MRLHLGAGSKPSPIRRLVILTYCTPRWYKAREMRCGRKQLGGLLACNLTVITERGSEREATLARKLRRNIIRSSGDYDGDRGRKSAVIVSVLRTTRTLEVYTRVFSASHAGQASASSFFTPPLSSPRTVVGRIMFLGCSRVR